MAAHQAPPSLGFSRQEHWSGLPFPSPMNESEKWKVKVKSLSRVRPSATPWTAAYQAPPSMGFSRQEYWSWVPLPSLRNSLSHRQNRAVVTRFLFPCFTFMTFYLYVIIALKLRPVTKPETSWQACQWWFLKSCPQPHSSSTGLFVRNADIQAPTQTIKSKGRINSLCLIKPPGGSMYTKVLEPLVYKNRMTLGSQMFPTSWLCSCWMLWEAKERREEKGRKLGENDSGWKLRL